MWLPEGMLRECIVEADRHAPLETGGTFMGYWIGTSAVVVTCLVGAGPGAERGVRHFAPDQDWQVAEIARCYERSGRMNTYVGDWHSHPGAQDGELSRKDRRVLRRIVETPSGSPKRRRVLSCGPALSFGEAPYRCSELSAMARASPTASGRCLPSVGWAYMTGG